MILIKNVSFIIDKNLNVFENKDILIEGKGPNATIKYGSNLVEKEGINKKDVEIIDGKGKCAMPGLTNTHVHLPMTLLRGVCDDKILQDWLNTIWSCESKLKPKDVYYGSLLGCLEMVRFGITSFNDMYFFSDEIVKAVKKIGLKGVISYPIIDFGTPDCKDVDKLLRMAERFISKNKNGNSENNSSENNIGNSNRGNNKINSNIEINSINRINNNYNNIDNINNDNNNKNNGTNNYTDYKNNNYNIIPAIGPHAPYTCSEDTYKECKNISDEYNTFLHTHISETRYEVVEMENKINMRPVQYLQKIGVLDKNVIGAHLVWITKEEVNILRKHNVKVSHCPVSNMKLASGGVMPIVEMINNNVDISIGTDGPASNNNYDILEDLKICSLLHKSHRWDPTVMNVDTLLKMAFNSEMIGFKNNDIVILDINLPHIQPINAHNIKSHIIYSFNGSDVDTVIVSGNILLKNKKFNFEDKFIYNIYDKINNINKKFYNLGEN